MKDRATQLLIKYKSGALVTQLLSIEVKDLASPELRAEKRPAQEGNDEEQTDSKSVYKTVHLVDKVFFFNCPPLFKKKELRDEQSFCSKQFYIWFLDFHLIPERGGGGLEKHTLGC